MSDVPSKASESAVELGVTHSARRRNTSAHPVAGRLLVVLQAGLFREGSDYYMKEVWWSYVRDRLLSQCAEMVLLAPVSTSAQERFQFGLVDRSVVMIAVVEGFCSTVLGIFRQVRRASAVWVFMPTLRGILTAVLCILLRKPYVLYFGSAVELASPRIPPAVKRGLGRFIVKRAGSVVAAGGQLVHELRAIRPDVEATIPAIHVSLTDVEETEGALESGLQRRPDWLYVGNLEERKRPEILLRALAEYEACTSAGAVLHVVGSTPTTELCVLAEQLGIVDQVQWHGYIPNGPSLWALYRRCGVFVLVSVAEGFPRVLYEAMALGLPIVTTPVGGVPFLLADGRDCLMVRTEDPAGVADAVESLMSDQGLRRQLVANALGVVKGIIAADGREQVHSLLVRAVRGVGQN